jgi:hypothetical protein
MWDIGTLVYSGDIAGAAEYISGKGFDIPNAGVNFSAGHEPLLPRRCGLRAQPAGSEPRIADEPQPRRSQGLGRAHGRREVRLRHGDPRLDREERNRPRQQRLCPGRKRHQRLVGLGDGREHPRRREPGPERRHHQLERDGDPDTLLLPTSKFLFANNTQLTNSNTSLLKFIQQNNSYSAITKQPLDIRPSRELETAGSGSTKRMIAYEKSPDNLEFFLPGMFEFLPPFAISSMSWRVDGIMNVGQLEVYRPKTMSYRDNI